MNIIFYIRESQATFEFFPFTEDTLIIMRIYFVIAQHCKIQSKLTEMLKNIQNLINVLQSVMDTYHGDNSGDIKMFIHTKFGLFSARQLGLNFSRRPIYLITKIQLVYRNRAIDC